MPDIIAIEVCIDTLTLLRDYPNPSKDYKNPTGIDHNKYSYMITQPTYARTGQATGDLTVNALVGDTIRWRSASLSSNADHAAVIYDLPKFAGDQVTGELNYYVASPPVPVPVLDGSHQKQPPEFKQEKGTDYYASADVINTGTEQYWVKFYVTDVDRETGKVFVKGYFGWDPTIRVPNPTTGFV